jgi:hypothetical protein
MSEELAEAMPRFWDFVIDVEDTELCVIFVEDIEDHRVWVGQVVVDVVDHSMRLEEDLLGVGGDFARVGVLVFW